jgi:hypothetical protein
LEETASEVGGIKDQGALPEKKIKIEGDAMRSHKTFLALAVLICTTLLFTACPNQESIARISADPGRYQNRDVIVSGRVTNSYGVLGRGAYELDDGTGKIWVVTETGVPSKGSRVGVQGRVQSGINFGGRNFGLAMYEDKRKVQRN